MNWLTSMIPFGLIFFWKARSLTICTSEANCPKPGTKCLQGSGNACFCQVPTGNDVTCKNHTGHQYGRSDFRPSFNEPDSEIEQAPKEETDYQIDSRQSSGSSKRHKKDGTYDISTVVLALFLYVVLPLCCMAAYAVAVIGLLYVTLNNSRFVNW